jgi:hypothetical protein
LTVRIPPAVMLYWASSLTSDEAATVGKALRAAAPAMGLQSFSVKPNGAVFVAIREPTDAALRALAGCLGNAAADVRCRAGPAQPWASAILPGAPAPPIVLWATDVAALVGRHRYRPRAQALLDVLARQKQAPWIEVAAAARADPEVAAALAAHDPFRVISAAVPHASELLDRRAELPRQPDVSALPEPLREEAAHVISGAALPSQPLLAAVAQADGPAAQAVAVAGQLAAAAREAARVDASLQAADPEKLSRALTRAADMKRGHLQEAAVLGQVGKRARQPVAQRGEWGSLRGPGYLLQGKVDGRLPDGTIVEVKTRAGGWFSAPPAHDVIQLRAYLAMFGAARGLLVEESQRDATKHRETEVLADAAAWGDVAGALAEAVRELRGATAATARRWAREAAGQGG